MLIVISYIQFKTKSQEKELLILRKADKLKTEFLAQMSHEIRSPVNVILSFSNLIKSEVGDKIDPEIRAGFSSIFHSGKRIIRTIDLLLNMSEMQTGTYDYIPREINIKTDVIEGLILEYKPFAKEKNISMELIEEAEIKNMYLDEYTVNQIFANLIDNALKYTHSGSIKIRIGKKNNQYFVSVEDSGIGIKQEYIPFLFDAFTQEEQGYKRRFEGNGLGLALVKKYCELNSADIKVESKKGVGTKFTVTFSRVNDIHPDQIKNNI